MDRKPGYGMAHNRAAAGKRAGYGRTQSKAAQPAKNSQAEAAPARAMLLGLDPATARRAIILSEIIGPPVSKKRGQKRR